MTPTPMPRSNPMGRLAPVRREVAMEAEGEAEAVRRTLEGGAAELGALRNSQLAEGRPTRGGELGGEVQRLNQLDG